MALHCPSCGSEVDMLVDHRCAECSDAEIVATIEWLRP